ALARAHTSLVRATSSDLIIDGDPGALDPALTYRAAIRDLPSADVLVCVDGSVPGADRLAATLAAAQGLAVVGSDGRADLRLTAVDDQLCLVRPGAARSLVAS